MTTITVPTLPEEAHQESQRFVFQSADWNLYEQIGHHLAEQRAFITYHKGRLEVVTVSLLHERVASLLAVLIGILAEETDTPLLSAGMATLQRIDLDEGVEPDSSFYIGHEAQMRGKKQIDLSVDPPPDLALEVEVTRRLGVRKSIYRDLGVPEVWVYSEQGLNVLVRENDAYKPNDRSPTFPLLSVEEMYGFIATGLTQNQTSWTKSLRKRVQEIVQIQRDRKAGL